MRVLQSVKDVKSVKYSHGQITFAIRMSVISYSSLLLRYVSWVALNPYLSCPQIHILSVDWLCGLIWWWATSKPETRRGINFIDSIPLCWLE
jgi:hypothetical protein